MCCGGVIKCWPAHVTSLTPVPRAHGGRASDPASRICTQLCTRRRLGLAATAVHLAGEDVIRAAKGERVCTAQTWQPYVQRNAPLRTSPVTRPRIPTALRVRSRSPTAESDRVSSCPDRLGRTAAPTCIPGRKAVILAVRADPICQGGAHRVNGRIERAQRAYINSPPCFMFDGRAAGAAATAGLGAWPGFGQPLQRIGWHNRNSSDKPVGKAKAHQRQNTLLANTLSELRRREQVIRRSPPLHVCCFWNSTFTSSLCWESPFSTDHIGHFQSPGRCMLNKCNRQR